MNPLLESALAVVLADLARTGAPLPRVEDSDWTGAPRQPSAMLWSGDGSGSGVSIELDADEPQRLATLADQVQEWVVEELWARGRSTSWPPCPRHPDGHPLAPTVSADQRAVWVCPVAGETFATVGALTV